MSASIVIPSVIQGPAYIGTGGVIIYVKDRIDVEEIVESWNPPTTFGDAGERHKSRIFRLSFTPVGAFVAAQLNWMYAAHITPASYVGRSIFPASNFAVTIYSVAENETYGYVRGGIGKPPDLFCGPSATGLGQMELLCIGASATLPTATNFIKQTAASMGSLDTSYNPSKVVTDIYQGVLGSLLSPYNSLGGMDGFMIRFGYKTKNIMASDVGIGDVILDAKGYGIGLDFAPSNLTEAQVDTLIGYQGTNAILPGQAYAGTAAGVGGTASTGNMVLTGVNSGAAFTVGPLGVKTCKRIYQIGEHRFPKGALSMTNVMSFTTGAPTSLFSFTGIS